MNALNTFTQIRAVTPFNFSTPVEQDDTQALTRFLTQEVDAYIGIQLPKSNWHLDIGHCFHSLCLETGVPIQFPKIGRILFSSQIPMIIETALCVPWSDRSECSSCEKELPVILKYSRIANDHFSTFLWLAEYFIICPDCHFKRDTREMITSDVDCLQRLEHIVDLIG